MYLNHVTLSTGHTRRSPRAEVSSATIEWLNPWLSALLAEGGTQPLPEPSLAAYSAAAHIESGGLVMTVFCDGDAIVTFGVAARSRQSAELWAYLCAGKPLLLSVPAVPWCAVALREGYLNHPDASGWLGDFERCVAWTWLERKP